MGNRGMLPDAVAQIEHMWAISKGFKQRNRAGFKHLSTSFN